MDAVNQKALEELKKYKADGCHMLVPCMEQIAEVSAGFRLIVTPVQLRPHPKDKDVYPHESGHYNQWKNEWYPETGEGQYKKKIDPKLEMVRISGQGLEKLAQHTAIAWDRPTVRIDKEHPGRQLCELAGAIRMPDGFSFYRISDLYGMDLDIVREQLEMIHVKGETEPAEIKKGQYKVNRDLLQKKTNQTKLCISGARNRVIRKILGVDGTYTVESMGKPFIAVRVIPWLDMSDPYTRQLVTEMNVKQMAITSLFGGQMPEQRQIEALGESAPAISYDASIPADQCKGDVIDAEEATHYKMDPRDDAPPFMDAGPTPTSAESLRADFENSEAEGQCKVLVIMAGEKGFALNAWLKKFDPPTTLQKLSAAKRLEVYDFLCGKEKAA